MKRNGQQLKEHHRAKCLVSSFLFFFLIQFSFAQSIKYDINDPRNPDCPCHKLQKQAEEEYRKMRNVGSDIVMNKYIEQDLQIKPVITSATSTVVNHKRKKKTGWTGKWRFKYKQRFRGIKRIQTDYSVCYKW